MTTLTVLVGSIYNAVEVTNYDKFYFMTDDGVLLLKNNCPVTAVHYEPEQPQPAARRNTFEELE